MSKFILGSGIVGLLARHILGSEYHIIPFKKSRYYSHQIPTADNEIPFNKSMEDVLKSLRLPYDQKFFSVAVSYAGGLFFNKHVWVQTVIDKIYGENPHPIAANMLTADYSAHKTTAKKLYEYLMAEYSEDIIKNLDVEVSKIEDDHIYLKNKETTATQYPTETTAIPYDRIISTIPLDVLFGMLGMCTNHLEAANYAIFLVNTDVFDLEGADRCFIGDATIPFWKVNVIGDGLYQFFANCEVHDSDPALDMMTKKRYRLIASTTVEKSFPLGVPPELDHIEEKRITCVGSNARWDYFCDITTSVNKILKLK